MNICLWHNLPISSRYWRVRKLQTPTMSLRIVTLVVASALMGGNFIVDCATGREVDLWLLYLIPIGLASFVLGARYGYALTLAAALLLVATRVLQQHAFPSLSTFLTERGTEATVYVVSVYIIGLVRLAVRGTDGGTRMDTPTRMH